jgi:hypothetical protein
VLVLPLPPGWQPADAWRTCSTRGNEAVMPPFRIEDWEGYTGLVAVGVTCRSVMIAPLATIVCNEDFVGSKDRAY